jgi:7-carboxy-7-deazaguanine synthase
MQSLPLMEAFCTIQGEGSFQGSPAFFIRLGGCGVGCPWCGGKESWDPSVHPMVKIEDIVNQALKHKTRLAVITGGEPLMYNLDSITTHLKHYGFRTHLETSGAYSLTGAWDWICLSPKKFKIPVKSIYEKADELKIIIYNSSDFEWAEEQMKLVRTSCRLYLQPEWGKMMKMMREIVEYVKKNPDWKISLQVHKFMNIP